MSEDLSALFSVNAAELIEAPKGESVFYQVSAAKGKDKVYESTVRFLPNIFNPAKSRIKKWSVWLTNADTEEKKSVDVPDGPCLLQDAFFAHFNSESAKDKEMAKKFQRRENFYTLVYIVNDVNQPHLNGKIKVWKFGPQVAEILDNAAKDADEPINYLDIFKGNTFKITCVEKSGYNNYTQSKFLSRVDPLMVNGKEINNNKKDLEALATWLRENSTDLSQYEYAPENETPEIKKFIVEAIKSIVPSGRILDKILKKGSSTNSGPTKKSKPSTEEVTPPKAKTKAKPIEIVEDDDDDDETLDLDDDENTSTPILDDDDDDDETVIDLDDDEDDELDMLVKNIGKSKKSKASKMFDDEEDD